MKRASADVGLMFTAYNLRRIFNILGRKTLMEYLEGFTFNFQGLFHQIRLYKIRSKVSDLQRNLYRLWIDNALNLRIFNQKLIKTEAF